ncbi:MAG: biopolymer transporter ExbD [Alistipes sp.]|nr:biopolymer transporter ExbD [Alistipes sp.]
MAGNKRKVPEVNSSSQADIAFSLLIFFLVATTMNVDTGLVRVLPPLPEENVEQKEVEVKERNLYLVFVNGSGSIMAGLEGKPAPVDIHDLTNMAKEFILNPYDDPTYPEKVEEEFELPDGSKWVYPVSQGVISLQTADETPYQVYIMVQNELTRAFNEVRDEVSNRKFGVDFSELSEDQRKVITKAVPLKVSEAEPRKVGKK